MSFHNNRDSSGWREREEEKDGERERRGEEGASARVHILEI